jgi:hypothetical protein
MRQRLTNETLRTASKLALAKDTVRLAESFLGPGAADREILATARALQNMSPQEIRNLNQRRATIQGQTRQLGRRAANPDGSDDILEEAGPRQPDPTNNQAYVKQVMTTPDHAVIDSLQRRDIHAPTANRKLVRQRRKAADEDVPNPMESMDDLDDQALHGEDEDDGFDPLELQASEGDDLGDLDDEDEAEDEDGDEDFDLEEDDKDLEAMLEFAGDDGDGPPDLNMEDDADGVPDLTDGDNDIPDMEGLGDDDDMGDGDDMGDMEDPDVSIDTDDDGDPDVMVDTDDDDLNDGDAPDVVDENPMKPTPNLAPNPMGSRRNQNRNSSRQASRKRNAFTLEDILSLDDDGSVVASNATTSLEGDDLDALIGRKVARAGNRSACAQGYLPKVDASSRTEGYTWDTENEPEITGRPRTRRNSSRSASSSVDDVIRAQKPAPRRRATQAPYSPDRRRIASAGNQRDPFEDVFGVPDVKKYFQD